MQYPDEAPTFDGRPNPKAFIDWVNEMDHFFDWHKLSDDRKVRFAKLKLISRAKFFWYNIEAKRGQNPITDWIEMIEVLSNKYLPHSYQDRLVSMEQKKNLEAMQKSKNQIIEVLEQIENISNELREIKMKMQQFKKETKAAIIIQTHWRRHKAYSSYMHLQKAAIVFQYSWRRRVAWKTFEKLKIATRKKDPLQLESVPKVERIDLIGVDNFLCVLPCNLKIDIIWSLGFEEFKFQNQTKLVIYFKYLIRWRGRIQYLTNSRSSSSQWRRMMRDKIVFIYLLILVFFNFIISCFYFKLIRILFN